MDSKYKEPFTAVFFYVCFGTVIPMYLLIQILGPIFAPEKNSDELTVSVFAILYILAWSAYLFFNRDLNRKQFWLGVWQILWIGLLIGPTWPMLYLLYKAFGGAL